MVWTVLLSILAVLFFNACSDTNNVTAPPGPAAPGPLTILTSSPLPAGTMGVPYDITLALSGGTPPYTWSVIPGSPALPDGLALTPPTGNISGTPTTTGTRLTEFKLQDSKGQAVQKVLSITVNRAPIPLAILTNSLPPGSINQLYAFALSPTGGTTPYTWDLKAGTPPLPSGLTLSSNGVISGTPTVTSNATHTFTLTDATLLTVEKPLKLSINAIPLLITTNSLPQGTRNQSYNPTTLAASGGTPPLTWSPIVSPALPSGLTFNATTATISGIPTVTSKQTHTFTITDSTAPTNQTATKALLLTIGAAAPPLTINTNSLPSGTVTVPYPSTTLAASGGTPPYTWSTVGGLAPAPGLTLSSGGVISGTPSSNISSPFTRTYRVQDSAAPPQVITKDLTITVGLPTALNISTPSLPNGVLNQPYSQTVQATGGSGTRNWSFLGGNIPNLTIGLLTGVIAGNPTPTGQFTFTVQVTDALFTDKQDFTITITAPPAPQIMTSSLPTGTVNVPYPATTITATGGEPPLNFQPIGLPFGLSFNVTPNSSTATITGTPTSNGFQNVTFTVNDSTVPFNQTGNRKLLLTVNAALTIDTTTPLPAGTVDQSYAPVQLAASGGAPPYTWSITGTGGPSTAAPGLTLSSGGEISGTPSSAGSFARTYRVQDNNGVAVTKSLTLNVNAVLTIDNDSPLPAGKVGDPYGPVTLTASGGTPPYTWSTTTTPALPLGLLITPNIIPPDTATISGIPLAAESNVSHTFIVQDSTNLTVNKDLSLTIEP